MEWGTWSEQGLEPWEQPDRDQVGPRKEGLLWEPMEWQEEMLAVEASLRALGRWA